MKKIKTTDIAGLAKAPFIKATHDHIKESVMENDSDIIKGLLGSYTTNDLIILYGCVVTATIPGTSSITTGAIYYNGEIYQVDANASLITTGVQTLVWGVVTTYRSGDPVQWSDGVSRSLHQVDKLALTAGASGSGLADYNGATVKSLSNLLNVDRVYKATSVSSHTIGIGSKVFVCEQTHRAWAVGVRLRITDAANLANYMEGVITAYSILTTSVTIFVDTIGGSGTIASWTINLGSTPINAAGVVETGASIVLKTKVIEIGDWNMDTTASVSVAHGIDNTKARDVSVLIRDDANTAFHVIHWYDSVNNFPAGSIGNIGGTNVVLSRTATSLFDNVNYDSTGFNRGWITIVYEA